MNKKLIKLSPDEVFTYHMTTLGEFLVLGVNVIETTEESIHLDKKTLEQALCFMQSRHPLMRASLLYEGDEIFYKIHDELPLDSNRDIEYECLKTRDDLITRLEEFNCKLFSYKTLNSKLWRAFAYEFTNENQQEHKQFAVGLLMPLFITDGINITTLGIELVNIINSLISKTECNEMNEKLELIPNLDEIVDEHKLIDDSKKQHIKHLNNEPRIEFKLSTKFRCNNERGFKLNLFTIDQNLTERIVKENKLNKTKLTAYLTSIAFYALNDLYIENNIQLPKDLLIGLATNLRFRVQPNLDFSHIRSFTTYVDPVIPYPTFGQFENSWKAAKIIDELVDNATAISSGAIFKHSHNFDGIYEMNNLFSSKTNDINYLMNFCDSISDTDISISNAGTYVFNKKKLTSLKPFKIEETYYTDSICNTRTCLLGALNYHISFWNGKLMVALCSNKAAIGSVFSERLVKLFIENLKKSLN